MMRWAKEGLKIVFGDGSEDRLFLAEGMGNKVSTPAQVKFMELSRTY